MRAARLRHYCKLQVRSNSADSLGQQLNTWTDVTDVWCGIEPLRGRDLIAAQQDKSEVTHKIVMRYRSDITSANRIMFGTRIFSLGPPINTEERNRDLEFMATEGLNNG